MSRRENNLKRMREAKRIRSQQRKAEEEKSSPINSFASLDSLIEFIKGNKRILQIHEDNLAANKVYEAIPTKVIRTLSVLREDVEKCDIEPLFYDLCEKLYDRETVIQRRQDVRLVFRGYDNDARGLHEIPEVRTFLCKLDKVFPYMFYFAAIDPFVKGVCAGFIPLLCASTCSSLNTDGQYEASGEDIGRFFVRHFAYMNQIFKRFSLDQDLNMQMSQKIDKHLSQYIQIN